MRSGRLCAGRHAAWPFGSERTCAGGGTDDGSSFAGPFRELATSDMTWHFWTLVAAAAAVIAAPTLAAIGSARWTRSAQALLSRLDATRLRPRVERFDARELVGLPAPVQRFFRVALTDGQSIVTAVAIQMHGRFNLSATGEAWRPFTSRQRVRTCRPGFVWDARIAMLPGVAVRVIDSYVGGQGLLKASVLGLFGVADLQGDGEIARGEFMRYCAETVWYPTALLPSQGVRWDAVDDRSARAHFSDGSSALSLLFRFDATGLVASFRSDARGGMVGHAMVQAPWEGRFSNHRVRDGMTVPLVGEVAWIRPEGRRSYFEGAVTQLVFEHEDR